METFSAVLAICAGNSPVTVKFHAQMPVARGFDGFFGLRLNEVNNREAVDLRRHRAHVDVTAMLSKCLFCNLLNELRKTFWPVNELHLEKQQGLWMTQYIALFTSRFVLYLYDIWNVLSTFLCLVHIYIFWNSISSSSRVCIQYLCILWPLLLTWFNFNPSMDK